MGQRKDGGNGGGNSGWVTTDVAAEALGVSSRTVRNYILNEDLVARKETEGINERYLVSIDSLYALRDRRKDEGKLSGKRRRGSSLSEASAEGAAELVRETAVDMLRETLASLETHIAQNAELRARLELTERAESTVREERDRLLAELEAERLQRQDDVQRERSERLEAQQRVERLGKEHVHLEEEHVRVQGEAARPKRNWRPSGREASGPGCLEDERGHRRRTRATAQRRPTAAAGEPEGLEPRGGRRRRPTGL